MKATIKTSESFLITVNGIECDPFTKESTWNGLACYKNKHSVIIAVDDRDFIERMFIGLASSLDKKSKDLEIVMCSPCFQSPEEGEKNAK